MCRPGTCRAPFSSLASTVYRMELTRVDFPDPDTPVTATNTPSGTSTVRSRRLCSRAPTTRSILEGSIGRRTAGSGIALRPDR